MPDPKLLTYILAGLIGACLMLTLGAFLGKKFKVFRIMIFAIAVAVISVVIFAIYFAYLGISGKL